MKIESKGFGWTRPEPNGGAAPKAHPDNCVEVAFVNGAIAMRYSEN